MTDRFAQIILPQPGSDWKTYALALNAQLTRVIQQLSRIQATGLDISGGSYVLPIKNSSGRLVIDEFGNILDENGNIIIDATGLHVLDINDFKWIDGPNVYIDTEKLVDNAITTAKLAAQAVTADKFYGNLEPIEIVEALPDPSGYVGPSIVLLNGKVYRYDAGAWHVNVDTSDLTGTITSTQIDDDSISTPKLQANAVKAGNIDAGAVVADKLAAGAVTAVKLAAASVVAGKIATNAIVANDGVIGTAAIVDAMIANLNASKINAGDIAAQRMEANIVQALVGKFAVLSAIVSILGTVTVGANGYLRTEGVTSFSAGTGVFLGDNGAGTYVFRVGSSSMQFKWDGTTLVIGNPTGARWEFSGGSGAFINAAGETLFASGTAAAEVLNSRQLWSQVSGAADLGNLIPDVDFADTGWTLPANAAWSLITPWYGLPGKKAIRYDEQTVAPTGTFISDVMSPSAVNAPVTPGETVYWSYWHRSDAAANGTADFYIRFYDSAGSLISESGNSPTLPQASAGQHSGKAVVPALAVSMGYRFRRGSSAAGASTNGWVQWSQVRLSRTQDGATVGATIGEDLVGQFNQTSWNTYISSVLIDKANIGSLYANTITGNKTIGSVVMDFNATGTQPILYKSGAINVRADGYLEALNIKARGDIEATTINATAANIVKNLNIEGFAVTIPIGGTNVINVSAGAGSLYELAAVDFKGAPCLIIVSVEVEWVEVSSEGPPVCTVSIYKNGANQRAYLCSGGTQTTYTVIHFDSSTATGLRTYGVRLDDVGAAGWTCEATRRTISVVGLRPTGS